MIAACPKCGARYRIDRTRLRPEGSRLRCARCEAIFRVRAPEPAEPSAAAAVGAVPVAARTGEPADPMRGAGPDAGRDLAGPRSPSAPRVDAPSSERLAGAGTDAASSQDRQGLVLVADADVAAGKATAGAISGWGLEAVLVHDGVEAILTIQRTLPRVVVLDAGLPKMFGFQVCELMKRNESLRAIQVVLIGTIHHRDRYRRQPSELYGADAYLERPQLPDALLPLLHGFGLPVASEGKAPPAPAPTIQSTPIRATMPAPSGLEPGEAADGAALPPPSVAAAPSVAPRPAAVAPAAAGAAGRVLTDVEVEKARRLARIIVSDVILYNQERFDAGVEAGNVVEPLDAELAEARGYFGQRVAADVARSGDFIAEELLRVARLRGMK